MPASPRDFLLYSRMTGKPMPENAMERMRMAPEVYQFTKNFAKQPNLLEKTGNAFKAVGEIGLRGLGEGYKSSQANEQRRMRVMEDELKQERAMEMMEFQANLPQKEQELTNTERNQLGTISWIPQNQSLFGMLAAVSKKTACHRPTSSMLELQGHPGSRPSQCRRPTASQRQKYLQSLPPCRKQSHLREST